MGAKGKGNGKKKGKAHSKKTKSSSRAPNPTSDCIFPREIVSNILSRLPVKSLLRFRCVSKPWRNLISKSYFIATHLKHHSSSLKQHSTLLLHTRHYESDDHVISLYNPPEPSVVELDNPFPWFFRNMMVVGSFNGIVCLCLPPWGDVLTLYNPAMRRYNTFRLSDKKPLQGVHSHVSIGLAYDSQENDYVILSVLCFRSRSTFVPDEVEMCSTKSSTWKKLKNDLGFRVPGLTCNVIVKGVPYWNAVMEDEHGLRDALIYFDMGRKAFDKLPMPGIRVGTTRHLIDLKDSLGMLIWDERDECNLDVWVLDDEDGWSKKYNVGPLSGFDRIMGCSWNGDIVAENENGIMLFDPLTSSVKVVLRLDNAKHGESKFLNYSESLVLIGEMVPVKVETPRDKLARENLLRAGINFKVVATDNPQRVALAM